MPANIREFHRAPTTAQALELLKRTETPTTALVVSPRLPDPPFAQAEAVVDLQALPLNTLVVAGDAIRIGALVDLQTLVTSATLAAVADGILVEAAALAAHFGLRNLATVAGAIDGATDNPPGPPEVRLALLALGAAVTLAGGSADPSSLARYLPAKQTMLQEVTIPAAASWRGALARVARSPRDQAIVAAAAAVSATTARVAVAGASAAPIVVETRIGADRAEVAAHLAAAVAEQTDPIGDYRGSVEYRRAMAAVLARRALNQVFSHGASA